MSSCLGEGPGGHSKSHGWAWFLLWQLAFVLVFWGCWNRWDLFLADGFEYFQHARLWSPEGSLDRQWSPLYTLFYSLFHLLLPAGSPFAIYVVHRLVILYLMALFFWWLSRRLFGPPLALALTLLLVCNQVVQENLHVVHTFGLVYCLLAVLLLTAKERIHVPLLASLCLLGSFARPEFLLGLLLLPASLLPFSFTARFFEWRHRRSLVAAAATTLFSIILFTMSSRDGPDRALAAFLQQGAWAEAGVSDISVGYLVEERGDRLFPGARTLPEAVLVNPAAVLEQIGRNTGALPGALASTVFLESSTSLFSWIGLLAALSAAVLAGPRPGGRARLLGTAMVPFLFASLCAALLFRPSLPYLVPWAPLLLVSMALLAGTLPKPAPGSSRWLWVPVVLLLAGTIHQARRDFGQPYLQVARLLARPAMGGQVVLAFDPRPICLYATKRSGAECRTIPLQALLADPPERVIGRDGVSLFLIDAVVRKLAHERGFSGQLAALENDPESHGFQEIFEGPGGWLAPYLRESGVELTARALLRR